MYTTRPKCTRRVQKCTRRFKSRVYASKIFSYVIMNEHYFDASRTFATRPIWHWIIVAYFHDVLKMYRTRPRNMLLYFNVILDTPCKFSTRRNDIYDPSSRIIKNPLNSTIFWTRHLNSATRRRNSVTRRLNSATRQLSSTTRQFYIEI